MENKLSSCAWLSSGWHVVIPKPTVASLQWLRRYFWSRGSTLSLFISLKQNWMFTWSGKMLYAFSVSGHMAWSIKIFLCWGWSHKGGSVSKALSFFFFFPKISTVIWGWWWSVPERDGCRFHKNAFKILTIPVYVFDKVLSDRSQSHKSWSMTSSSGMSGGTHTSRRKSPSRKASQSQKKSRIWRRTSSAVTL